MLQFSSALFPNPSHVTLHGGKFIASCSRRASLEDSTEKVQWRTPLDFALISTLDRTRTRGVTRVGYEDMLKVLVLLTDNVSCIAN